LKNYFSDKKFHVTVELFRLSLQFLRPTQARIQWVPGSFPGGKERPECVTDHSPPSSANHGAFFFVENLVTHLIKKFTAFVGPIGVLPCFKSHPSQSSWVHSTHLHSLRTIFMLPLFITNKKNPRVSKYLKQNCNTRSLENIDTFSESSKGMF
jgi:hypothetical protein